jgi:hypothetical protein
MWFRLLLSGKPADPDHIETLLHALLTGLKP